MPTTGLFGPFALTKIAVDTNAKTPGCGAYALGHVDPSDNRFVVERIGRSDNDLNARLHTYVGQYASFKYGYLPTVRDAFLKECRLYHDFSPPGNSIHPDVPNGTNLVCPVCGPQAGLKRP